MKERVVVFSRSPAFSLVIILAVVALLSALLVAFLTKSRMELQATVSYSNSIEANALARGAAEEVLGGLQAEVKTALANSSTTPALAIARVGSNATDPRISNLIRRSVGDASIFNTGYAEAGQTAPVQFASPLSTATASRNGRKISTARWNAPLLLSDTDAFTVPDWVIVTREGSKRVADGDVLNLRDLEDGGNEKAAVGRYAYMLYDVSGLLDANIAGVPPSETDPRKAQKGSEASADLMPIFAAVSANPNAFLNWRQGSLDRVFGTDPAPGAPGTPGELEIGSRATQSSPNRFISRQDLLKFLNANYGSAAKPLAPWFTTYSLSSNAPEITLCLSSTYNAAAEAQIPRYRIEDASSDPYVIKAGSSLFARKFPLSRLRWFEQRNADGSPKDEVRDAIKQHFGLTWFDNLAAAGISAIEYQGVGGFVYTSPDEDGPVSSIRTLAQVAALASKREPDFFEWLKEAVSTGSLGTSGGSTNTMLPGYFSSNTQEASKDFQIVQIGANIIDQSDSDDVPTLIATETAPDRNGDSLVAFGVENLPYINELSASVALIPSGSVQEIKAWLQPEIWCPHANADNPRRDSAGSVMTNFRVRIVEGRSSIDTNLLIRDAVNVAINDVANESRLQRTVNARTFTGAADDTLAFSVAAADYLEPAMVGGSSSANSLLWGTGRTLRPGPAPWEVGFSGILLGSTIPILANRVFPEDYRFGVDSQTEPVKDPDPLLGGSVTYPIGKKLYNQVLVSFDPNYAPVNTPAGSPATVVMEVAADGRWIPYQSLEQLQRFIANVQSPLDRYNATTSWSFPFDFEKEGSGPDSSWCKPLAGDPDPYPTANALTEKFFFGWNVINARSSMAKSDPRTRRFGVGSSSVATPGVGIRDTANPWIGQTDAAQATSGSRFANWDCREFVPMGVNRTASSVTAAYAALPNWTFKRMSGTRLSAPLADLGRNLDSGMLYYGDTDGVVRPADFAQVPDANFPTIPGQKRARPVLLNRPFRSVAELGYVFRDTPWKSMDMISARGTDLAKPVNADLGLLNVFCIEDNEMVSGKINPFIARPETLEAIFRGTQLNASDSDLGNTPDTIAATVAQDVVNQMKNATGAVATTADVLDIVNQANSVKPSASGSDFKIEAEAYARALTGVANRRTWTLLLDVIAQAGRYPQSATELEDFVVSGERRYWVHITLDRYTGKVMHMEYEPVYE